MFSANKNDNPTLSFLQSHTALTSYCRVSVDSAWFSFVFPSNGNNLKRVATVRSKATEREIVKVVMTIEIREVGNDGKDGPCDGGVIDHPPLVCDLIMSDADANVQWLLPA